VEALGLKGAIITATKLHRYGTVGLWFVHSAHFGFLVDRDSIGIWRFTDDRTPLPPADNSAGPQIIEPTGRAMLISHTPPKGLQ
jgi:hypothetical protein